MERDSILYKIRRKGQVLAYKIFSNEFLSKIYYHKVMGKNLNLENPQTFNEKLQWLKLYYYPKNDLVVKCTDKFDVRNYITDKGYSHLLTPLLGSWNNANEINYNDLPNKFVLKCNHGCAYNIVCNDKEKINIKKTNKKINKWLKEDFGAFNIETHYSKIKDRKVICEEFLGENITDYKFFCFNGEPKFIYVSNNLINDRQAQIGFFNLDGTKMEIKRDDYKDISNVKFPTFFDEMICVSKDLCKDFPFVRVDFFLSNNRYYFAELTFTPSACMMPFNPEIYDYKMGGMLDISNLV